MDILHDPSSFQWPLPPSPQYMNGFQWNRTSLSQLYQPYEMPFGWDSTFVEGKSIPDVEVGPLSSVHTEGTTLCDGHRTASTCHSVQPVSLGLNSQKFDPNSWREFNSIGWPPLSPVDDLMHSTPGFDRASMCSANSQNLRPAYDSQSIWLSQMTTKRVGIDSMAEMNAASTVRFAPRRLAEVGTVPLNTNISSNVHNGDHLPVERPFAAAIPASTAGPYMSLPSLATSVDVRKPREKVANSAIRRTKTRSPTREIRDARPHICTKHRTAYRHHGDLVRHKRTTPGHTAYQGPVTCVCRREYSRRDGMYKHLQTGKCTGPPRS